MKRQTFLLFSLFFISTTLFSQQSKNDFNTISVGVDFSTNVFFGDIKQDGLFNDLGFAGSLNAKKTFNSLFALRAEFGTGTLAGSRKQYASCEECYSKHDALLDTISTKFSAKYINYDASLVLNLSNLVMSASVKKKQKFKAFAEIGAGFLSFNSVLRHSENDNLIAFEGYTNSDLEKKSPQTDTYLKLGASVLYQLNKRVDISGKLKYYLTNTDELDAVYASGRDVVGIDNDKFLSFTLGVSYNIGSKKKALHWHDPLNDMRRAQNTMLKKVRGMSKDKDGDGVANVFDKHEDTPEGVAVDGAGVPLDIDNDGVFDYADNELFSNKNADVNANGVESDKDGDGIPDSEDLEVSEKGALVNYKGITISGEAIGSTSNIPFIHFATSSTKIRKNDFLKLAEVALIMLENPNDNYLVVGHADKRGASEYNQKLSEERANTVARYLIDIFDIQADRLQIVSKGETSPRVTTKDTSLAKYQGVDDFLNEMNRRVEFIKQ